MKTEKNILIAFILNFSFSIFEFFGGIFTGSVAILSDSIHDLCDAASIGISYFLEKKSKRVADKNYTYGYVRFSVLGGLITSGILLCGSAIVIYNAIIRIIHPVTINYNGMIIFSIFGLVTNFLAAYFTREGDSINQKSVNLHMLEDVLGWAIVLIGSIVMKFTDFSLVDSIMSIGVSLFIFINAAKNVKEICDIFLEGTPKDVDLYELKSHILDIDGVEDVHHIHIRSLDGYNNYATLHIVTKEEDTKRIKELVREELREHNIVHSVIETEKDNCGEGDFCECKLGGKDSHHHHHHHHHH